MRLLPLLALMVAVVLLLLVVYGVLRAAVALKRLAKVLAASPMASGRAPEMAPRWIAGLAVADTSVMAPFTGEACLWWRVILEGDHGLRHHGWGRLGGAERGVPLRVAYGGLAVHAEPTSADVLIRSRRHRSRLKVGPHDPRLPPLLQACGVEPKTAHAFRRLRVTEERLSARHRVFIVGRAKRQLGLPTAHAFREPSIVEGLEGPLLVSDVSRGALLTKLAVDALVGLAIAATPIALGAATVWLAR